MRVFHSHQAGPRVSHGVEQRVNMVRGGPEPGRLPRLLDEVRGAAMKFRAHSLRSRAFSSRLA